MDTVTINRATVEQALEALVVYSIKAEHKRTHADNCQAEEAITALRQALEQPAQQEPVGEVRWAADVPGTVKEVRWADDVAPPVGTHLYTAPQPAKREWVGLTPDERDALVHRADALLDHIYEYGTASEGIRPRLKSLFTAVEAKLRQKNGGDHIPDAGKMIDAPQPQPKQEPREHITDGSPCWCSPEVDYIDPETGAAVIVHRRPQ